MLEPTSLASASGPGRIAAGIAIVVLGGALGGYAIHEHHAAQNLAANNAQATAALDTTKQQLSDLKAQVNMLAARSETQAAPSATAAQTAPARRPAAARRPTVDPRFQKLQSQVDAQGKAIDQTRSDLESTNGDLASTRTDLSGSIARSHDELVALEKKGERNFYEFDVQKSKEFKHEGPVGISLRKANAKSQYADLMLAVDDRNLTQKHVNLYQPAMFYEPDSPQPIEVVINDIGKDHIHGYVSAPKYRNSELAVASNSGSNPQAGAGPAADQGDNDIVGSAPGSNQGSSNGQPATRQKLPLPQQ